MAGWMSGGTKGVKSRWVTIVVDREALEQYSPLGNAEIPTLRRVIELVGGRIYGE